MSSRVCLYVEGVKEMVGIKPEHFPDIDKVVKRDHFMASKKVMHKSASDKYGLV